jgi:hypothetical protein
VHLRVSQQLYDRPSTNRSQSCAVYSREPFQVYAAASVTITADDVTLVLSFPLRTVSVALAITTSLRKSVCTAPCAA